MSWLKKVGQIVAKATSVIIGLEPFIGTYLPHLQDETQKVKDTLGGIGGIIITVEAIGATGAFPDGAAKLKAATPLVAQLIRQSDLMSGKKIKDTVLFNAGAEKIANGMVDILNSLKDDDIDTDNQD